MTFQQLQSYRYAYSAVGGMIAAHVDMPKLSFIYFAQVPKAAKSQQRRLQSKLAIWVSTKRPGWACAAHTEAHAGMVSLQLVLMVARLKLTGMSTNVAVTSLTTV